MEKTEFLKGFHHIPVLCIGDIMLDQFIYGHVSRISPEAPIPVLKMEKTEEMLGGAGNVLRNLVALETKPFFMSVIGEDEIGKKITKMLKDEKISSFLFTQKDRPTTLKKRYISAKQQLLRVDQETVSSVSKSVSQKLLKQALGLLSKVKAVVISDYGKGVLETTFLKSLIQETKKKKIPVIIDPKGKDYSRYENAFLITPNRKELQDATDMSVQTEEEIIKAGRFLQKKYHIENVLMTRSEEGMSLLTPKDIFHFPAQAKEVFDVSGAGDSVAAVMTAGLAVKGNLKDITDLANLAGGLAVSKFGTTPVSLTEIIQALHQENDIHTDEVLSWKDAQKKRELWKNQNLKVGFTNGCFDLLHPGHISLLAQAKAACDRLVVGLNSDASVQRLKGPTRPVQEQRDRALVLSALSTVDLVVIFDQDTPLELIKTLKPDVLVKGADYTIDKVVGASFVQHYGGKVFLAKLIDGKSTTKTVQKLKQ